MIRLLEKSDKKQINKIIKAASKEEIFIMKKKIHLFGYFIEDSLVGIVGYYTHRRQKMIGFISAFVLPEFRKSGIYNQLAQHRLDHCKEKYQGYTIYVSTNSKSRTQLEKLGFELFETQYRLKLKI
jgi:N-acetylglutamate synthase-like GNAT family acetyltransferase